ncbi:PucR family transcriptional regulator [Mycolicibacterium sp. CR10]|uniref:PucR family transcriptional regulator n=1 Tax=Mycolicibacterium sp. CR10 TaxID=2562314 RepID=UPI0010C10AAF|nr:PucR family transcriptional regulator [Mycolicibacterium sp. CR10]
MITARGLTQVDSLGLTLVAGAAAADRDIAWAHAIELADPTPYLTGGELVMTTGINIGADAAMQSAYLGRLSSAGAAALAVDTGTTFSDVPAGVLAAGNDSGVPVLKVPASTPFIAIARVVIDAVKADELRSVQRVVDHQEVLARATLRGGIPAVVDALSDALSADVVVTGSDGMVLAAGGAEHPRLVTALAGSLRPAAVRRHAGYVTADGDALVTIQSLRVAQLVRGHLAVRTVQPLSNSDRLLLAHAVSLISITLEKPARVIDAEQRLRTAVAREMLSGSSTVDTGVLRYFGFEPDGDVVVVVVSGVGPVFTAEQNLGQTLSTAGAYLMAPRGDQIVIVVPSAGSKRRILHVIGEFARTSTVTPTAGASRPGRLSEVTVALQEACVALQCSVGSGVTEFDELGAFGALLGSRSAAELRIIAAPLDPLAGRDDDLIETLAAFLQHNGQLEAAAAELHVHRHTMRNRLRRISEVLADDLGSADTRARLWLAIKARKLLPTQV